MKYRIPVHPKRPDWWAEWVRKLRDVSGVYVIRTRRSKTVLYVGESHSDALYATLTRHFQWWAGFTAGTTYDRDRVEIGVEVLTPAAAKKRQVELIHSLKPRDNAITYEGEAAEAHDPSEFAD